MRADTLGWYQDSSGKYLTCRIDNPLEVLKEFEGKEVELTIKLFKKDRTLDQNALLWKAIGQLASKIGINSTDIYKELVKELGEYDLILIQEEQVEGYIQRWCANHIGRFCENLGESKKNPGCVALKCYFSSSDFNVEQMNRLIELLKQEFEQQEIYWGY